ncbi:MAG TPA: NVEALA domain-containing protein [Candidatus Phocaeicola caecigallinarum]|nr:NVEALA domain-containing protein [Candidatus Phocaeicola caecigallinarum]
MKKNILKITFAAALAVVAGVTAYQAQDKDVLSDLTLANVEALAGNESGTYTTWSCKGSVNKCGAKCGLCGTEIRPSKGTLTGSHSCSL